MAEVSIPAIEYMMSPTLLALHNLGGSGTNDDIYSEVVEILNLTPEQEAVMHISAKSPMTEIKYRLLWARTRLKQAGYIDNPRRAFWELTEKGWNTNALDLTTARNEFATKSKSQLVESRGENMKTDFLPPFQAMINPTLEALRELGDVCKKADIGPIVANKMQLADEQV